MKYDFTTLYDRRGRDAIAVDLPYSGHFIEEHGPREAGFDVIPLWVADMNFATAPSITEAMRARLEHPLFGYFSTRDEYYDAIIGWQQARNGVTGLTKEHIAYENGVLGGVASALRVLCSRGDKVLVHSPTYVGFTGVLENNGYEIVHSPLVRDESGIWRMDYGDMERKITENHIHTAIFCSPHNPCGRVWDREEIERAMDVYRRHDVFVISDEIWSDLTLADHRHIPTQSVSEDAKMRTAAFYAPSKTFSLAGLIGSYRIVYSDWLRDRLNKEESLSHYNSLNVLSMHALIGAYGKEGQEWLDELKAVLTVNVDYACGYIAEHFGGVRVSKPEGTYMLYLDCAEWLGEHGMTTRELLDLGFKYGVIWQDGEAFQWPCTIRMNLALPFDRVKEAFDRLDRYVFNA